MPSGRPSPVPPGQPAFAGAVVVSLVVLFVPAGEVPGALPGVDTIVHIALFASLAATGRWAGLRAAVLGAALVAYGGISELLQGLAVIGRTTSVADWGADVVGVLLGLAVWARVAGRPQP